MDHIRRRRDNRVGITSRPPIQQNGSVSASSVPVEESVIREVDELPQPAGFGTEASTSQQSSVLIESYQVPQESLTEITEVALSIQDNGQATISVSGVSYGPYTGPVDITAPLEGSRLTPGSRVRVFHQSTDGSSTTTLAQLVALEV